MFGLQSTLIPRPFSAILQTSCLYPILYLYIWLFHVLGVVHIAAVLSESYPIYFRSLPQFIKETILFYKVPTPPPRLVWSPFKTQSKCIHTQILPGFVPTSSFTFSNFCLSLKYAPSILLWRVNISPVHLSFTRWNKPSQVCIMATASLSWDKPKHLLLLACTKLEIWQRSHSPDSSPLAFLKYNGNQSQEWPLQRCQWPVHHISGFGRHKQEWVFRACSGISQPWGKRTSCLLIR